MFITLKYRLTEPTRPSTPPGNPPLQASVFLNAVDADWDAPIQYEGPEPLVSDIRGDLMRSYGFRARFIEKETSPRDLLCAMQGECLKPYQPELIAGAELFENL